MSNSVASKHLGVEFTGFLKNTEETYSFVLDKQSRALDSSHQHLVWVPGHRVSPVRSEKELREGLG